LSPAAARTSATDASERWTKPIPRSGERLPVVGLGTWITFNIGQDRDARARRQQVLQRFLAAGGGMIDSSPMYGSAEQVVGELLGPAAAGAPGGRVFAATKVWTPLDRVGTQQHRDSLRLWKRPVLDLQQVHNLLNWKAHLALLRAEHERGTVRYLGVTTSHGARHAEMERVLRSEPLDFLQITYNPVDESAEPLMRLAAERGVAVIVNRPFDGGALLQRLAGRPLPPVARDLGCETWAAAVLKWEVSHPAVTCAIPATSNPSHLDQNMAALRGPVPTPAQRDRLRAALVA
jgi:diketogulonate reductase-like aldo/keto reductase